MKTLEQFKDSIQAEVTRYLTRIQTDENLHPGKFGAFILWGKRTVGLLSGPSGKASAEAFLPRLQACKTLGELVYLVNNAGWGERSREMFLTELARGLEISLAVAHESALLFCLHKTINEKFEPFVKVNRLAEFRNFSALKSSIIKAYHQYVIDVHDIGSSLFIT